ncbi:nuclease-related domain-containing protein [Salinibacillus xinjiangensis]|uniref:NERD domain-containing protein n=1 Tax=Salinibacillus xinjiangensis TaxID=1229268 RepID=A0A6G1XBM9_9BACI|nr:nuclease-related domain-containing protein [Salinibacillus xinjiangensis]MRG88347.1 hypothetical protein [Salinibacillus xinjiangensis]
MVIKPYHENRELQLLRLLNSRMELSTKEKQHYLYLQKGYKGEKIFADRLESLPCEKVIIHDLLLEHNHTVFQIDTLLFSQNKIYLFEVKNYEGDYYIN